MKVLRMDLNRLSATDDETLGSTQPPEVCGGRLLAADIVAAEVDPGCDPLGPENQLVLATGPLAGWSVSCAGRLSVGAKSPLTGGIKESNAGGNLADALAGLGYRAVVLSGALPPNEPGLVILDEDGMRFEPAAGLWGLPLEETAAELQSRFGREYAYAAIGPAGPFFKDIGRPGMSGRIIVQRCSHHSHVISHRQRGAVPVVVMPIAGKQLLGHREDRAVVTGFLEHVGGP